MAFKHHMALDLSRLLIRQHNLDVIPATAIKARPCRNVFVASMESTNTHVSFVKHLPLTAGT